MYIHNIYIYIYIYIERERDTYCLEGHRDPWKERRPGLGPLALKRLLTIILYSTILYSTLLSAILYYTILYYCLRPARGREQLEPLVGSWSA